MYSRGPTDRPTDRFVLNSDLEIDVSRDSRQVGTQLLANYVRLGRRMSGGEEKYPGKDRDELRVSMTGATNRRATLIGLN